MGCKDLRRVVLDKESKLKYIGRHALSCQSLKNITLPEGLKEIWDEAFAQSGLEEITLPATLKLVRFCVFAESASLKTIYVEDGCNESLFYAKVPNSTRVGPPPDIVIGDTKVWDLREQKIIIIPDGAERIGNHWFWGCAAESVVIPASVREIDTDAFCGCEKLKRAIFAEDSKLEKFGAYCFSNSGIEKIVIPKGVKELQSSAFRDCNSLKEVVFENNS